jgi:hypothetical protein
MMSLFFFKETERVERRICLHAWIREGGDWVSQSFDHPLLIGGSDAMTEVYHSCLSCLMPIHLKRNPRTLLQDGSLFTTYLALVHCSLLFRMTSPSIDRQHDSPCVRHTCMCMWESDSLMLFYLSCSLSHRAYTTPCDCSLVNICILSFMSSFYFFTQQNFLSSGAVNFYRAIRVTIRVTRLWQYDGDALVYVHSMWGKIAGKMGRRVSREFPPDMINSSTWFPFLPADRDSQVKKWIGNRIPFLPEVLS